MGAVSPPYTPILVYKYADEVRRDSRRDWEFYLSRAIDQIAELTGMSYIVLVSIGFTRIGSFASRATVKYATAVRQPQIFATA